MKAVNDAGVTIIWLGISGKISQNVPSSLYLFLYFEQYRDPFIPCKCDLEKLLGGSSLNFSKTLEHSSIIMTLMAIYYRQGPFKKIERKPPVTNFHTLQNLSRITIFIKK